MEFRELVSRIERPRIEGPLGEKLYNTRDVSVSFGLGPSGSGIPIAVSVSLCALVTCNRQDCCFPGVQWHVHGPGFSEVYHGRKRWMLYRPEYYHAIEFDPDQTALQWLLDTNKSNLFGPSKLAPPICCTINPKEVLYFPPMWPHAILNIGETVSSDGSFLFSKHLQTISLPFFLKPAQIFASYFI